MLHHVGHHQVHTEWHRYQRYFFFTSSFQLWHWITCGPVGITRNHSTLYQTFGLRVIWTGFPMSLNLIPVDTVIFTRLHFPHPTNHHLHHLLSLFTAHPHSSSLVLIASPLPDLAAASSSIDPLSSHLNVAASHLSFIGTDSHLLCHYCSDQSSPLDNSFKLRHFVFMAFHLWTAASFLSQASRLPFTQQCAEGLAPLSQLSPLPDPQYITWRVGLYT